MNSDGTAGGVPSRSPYYYAFSTANVHIIVLDPWLSWWVDTTDRLHASWQKQRTWLKDMLELDAKVWVGSVTSNGKNTGLLGTGSGKLVLDWNKQQYSLDVKASMLDGVFTFEGDFLFNAGTSTQPAEVIISAEADVNIPHGIPLIGGKELGSSGQLGL